MKAKELFTRLIYRDGNIQYRKQGLITFDSKGNTDFAQGGSFELELIPSGYSVNYNPNPYFTISDEAVYLGCDFINNSENYNIKIDIDNGETLSVESPNDEFEYANIVLTKEIIDMLSQVLPDSTEFYSDKEGAIYCSVAIDLSHVEGFEPFSYGTHTYTIYIDGTKLYEGEFEVE